MDEDYNMEPVPYPKAEGKLAKMENGARLFNHMLLPAFPEYEDSGIDSDSNEVQPSSARHVEEGQGNLNEPSSSDEDSVVKPWWQRPPSKQLDRNFLNVSHQDREPEKEMKWSFNLFQRQMNYYRTLDELSRDRPVDDRASPPLDEIELTASEEDDDGSVLELVIPMQNPRYKRVPTASPNKAKTKPKPKSNRNFYRNLICCMRK